MAHTSLASFPPEVLRLITCYLSLKELCRLTITGSARFNAKLVNGGVTKVDMGQEDRIDFLSQFLFLESWQSYARPSNNESYENCLHRLPRSLRQICWTTAQLGPFDWALAFPYLDSLLIHSLVPSRYWNTDMPHSINAPLRTFSAKRLHPAALELLPPTLTSLSFSTDDHSIDIQWSYFSRDGDEPVTARFPDLQALAIAGFPPPLKLVSSPQLTSLKLVYNLVNFVNLDLKAKAYQWKYMPPGLEKLELEVLGGTPGDWPLEAQDITDHFPSKLKLLRLNLSSSPLSNDHIKALPKSLTHLSFSDARRNCAPTYCHYENLPPNLTYLELSTEGLINGPAPNTDPCRLFKFPSNLSTLKLRGDQINPSYLPHTVTHLEDIYISADQLSSLPPRLLVLSLLLGIQPLDYLKLQYTPLPYTITHLRVTSPSPFEMQRWLPKSLQSLTIHCNFANRAFPIKNPPDDWLSYLPKGLRSLEIHAEGSCIEDRHLKPLTKHEKLERLVYDFKSGKIGDLTQNCFKDLPGGLKTLHLDICPPLDGTNLALLPCGLRALKLVLRPAERPFSPKLLLSLPPKVHTFDFRGRILDPDDWKSLGDQLHIKTIP